MKKAIVIGAGAIGKGVAVPLFLHHNYHVTLANRSIDKILNPVTNSYRIYDGTHTYVLSSVSVCGLQGAVFERAMHEADVVVSALRDEAIPFLKKCIRDMLIYRLQCRENHNVTIILCSNHIGIAKDLLNYITKYLDVRWLHEHVEIRHLLVFVAAHMDSEHLYDVCINTLHSRLEMEKSRLTKISDWPQIYVIRDADCRLKIKLGLINRVQLYFALQGRNKGYQYMYECFDDSDMFTRSRLSFEECYKALTCSYPEEVDDAFAELLWERLMQGRSEAILRFMKDINEKLSIHERIYIPIQCAIQHRLSHTYMDELVMLAKKYLDEERVD